MGGDMTNEQACAELRGAMPAALTSMGWHVEGARVSSAGKNAIAVLRKDERAMVVAVSWEDGSLRAEFLRVLRAFWPAMKDG